MTAPQPIGRPLKFQSVEELETQINLYFDDCDKTEDTRVWSHDEIEPQDDGRKICTNCWKEERSRGCLLVSGRLRMPRPYTVTGLALWLETTRHTLLNYQERPEFLHTISAAKLRIENYAAERLFDKDTPTRGVIFSLSNNSEGWVEKTKQTLTVEKDAAKELADQFLSDVADSGEEADTAADAVQADQGAEGKTPEEGSPAVSAVLQDGV